MTWFAILTASATCFGLKLVGLSLPASWLEPPALRRAATLLPVGLLASLIATQTFGSEGELVIDARVVGFLVALIAVAVRLPFAAVVGLAAVATAAGRAVASG